jgi:hypothetical protein
LTKATDRFPIILQQVLLEVIVNTTFAEMWMKLISDWSRRQREWE